jgi:hypothetical protein
MLGLSVLLRALATAIAWLVFARLYGRGPGLALACVWAVLNPEPIFKYTEFTLAVNVPLYFHACFASWRSRRGPRRCTSGSRSPLPATRTPWCFTGGIMIAVIASVTAWQWEPRRKGARGAWAPR